MIDNWIQDIMKNTIPNLEHAYSISLIQLTMTLYHPVLSADNLCKQLRPRSGLTKCQAWSGSKLFNNLIVPLKEFLEYVNLETNQQ